MTILAYSAPRHSSPRAVRYGWGTARPSPAGHPIPQATMDRERYRWLAVASTLCICWHHDAGASKWPTPQSQVRLRVASPLRRLVCAGCSARASRGDGAPPFPNPPPHASSSTIGTSASQGGARRELKDRISGDIAGRMYVVADRCFECKCTYVFLLIRDKVRVPRGSTVVCQLLLQY
ncbi:hypothetical protein HYPSUDRAFT_204613 [Hypholoma sublateritium FD-334 SS-4]|uniref:Uncharacterized protein n=1 Tax=Hypholoma sublateritium (strain FD-334 SS-4) TaxID=945553 RepID=A0A0D2NRS1_HYPSF|nr:hypothetical protein HYPSUDRAFT_204613 [Hypholoma sublateritium FD-334 SS-4]